MRTLYWSGRGEVVHVSGLQVGDKVHFSDGPQEVEKVEPRPQGKTWVTFAGLPGPCEYEPSDWLGTTN